MIENLYTHQIPATEASVLASCMLSVLRLPTSFLFRLLLTQPRLLPLRERLWCYRREVGAEFVSLEHGEHTAGMKRRGMHLDF